jgi:hypothetical protein
MQEWSGVFSVTGASAATLLGLLFVAISVHSGASGSLHQNSRLLAEQAFQNYLVVMLVSLLSLFPALSLAELGYATLGLTALRAAFAVVRMYRATMQPYGENSRLQALRRQLPSLVGFGLLIVASARMAQEAGTVGGDARTMFASGIVMLLFAATTVAWELLLRISAEKRV